VRAQASTIIAPLYQRFIEEGYDVIVSHPRKARYIAEAHLKLDRAHATHE
jgi:hypothetical protein